MTRAVPIYDHQGECVWVWVCVSECMRVFGQGTDDQVRRKRTSLLESAGKEGWRKGEKRGVGLFKKKKIRGFFLLPCTQGQICVGWSGEWHLCPGCRVGLCSWLWIEFRCLGCLHLKCFLMNCPASQREIIDPLYLTHFLSSTNSIHCCMPFKCGKKVPFWMMSPFIERPLFSI